MEVNNSISMLIVDDEPHIRKGIAEVIDWGNYGIRIVGTAEDGEQACQMALTLRPQIIITDIRMIRMDGLKLIERLKKEKLKSKYIIISGFSDFEYARQAICFGVKEYILKPFGKQKIIDTVISIRDEILNEASEKSKLQKEKNQLVQGLPAIKEKFFKELIEGRYIFDKDINAKFELYDIGLCKENLVVAVLQPITSSTTTVGGLMSKDIKLLVLDIVSILDELIQNVGIGRTCT